MKINVKINRSSRYRHTGEFICKLKNFSINVDLVNNDIILRNVSIDGISASIIESGLAQMRGYFSHKENRDRLIKLRDDFRRQSPDRLRGHSFTIGTIDEAMPEPNEPEQEEQPRRESILSTYGRTMNMITTSAT